jgi:formylglycine-generating enzyme required for sulfatase activity
MTALKTLSRGLVISAVGAGAFLVSGYARQTGRDSAAARIDWVSIPGGAFEMGADIQGDKADLKPVHRVAVKPFKMARTLVTNKQYRACVDAGVCEKAYLKGGDDQPVVGVDWKNASAFARFVGGRLPSESEWEYAARSAGKSYAYPWGNEKDPECLKANRLDCGKSAAAVWRVCAKPAGNTEQGLCDMVGTVWQWTGDWYHDTYAGAPADGSAWSQPTGARSARGGANDGELVRRYGREPDLHCPFIGLRPVLD